MRVGFDPVLTVELAAALTPDGRLAALVELRRGRLRVLLGLPTQEVLP